MIEIRRGRREDAPYIIDFQIRMAKEAEDLTLDRPTVEKGVQAVFDDPHKGAYWIAELDGEVAGCLLTVPEWSDWRNGTVLWIHSVYVIPSARRRGVFPDDVSDTKDNGQTICRPARTQALRRKGKRSGAKNLSRNGNGWQPLQII